MRPVICIYHKDCVDGTTAAAVVLRRFPHAKCFPLSHGHTDRDLDDILNVTPRDARVYVVDSALAVEAFLARGNEVSVIDHHVSEHERVEALLPLYKTLDYTFDTTRSGSSLTWITLFRGEPIPQLIAYVEDSDLWNQALGENTKHVVHYLSIRNNDPHAVNALMDSPIEDIIAHGRTISEYTDATIARLITIPPLTLHIGQHHVPAFNITDHQSAAGNILAERFDRTVALFTIKGDQVKFSFRCLDHHTPSSLDLAAALGGGGHRNASGANMSLPAFLAQITSHDTETSFHMSEEVYTQ